MMIVSPTPVFRWTDNNGNPAVGWQVETYIAGSSTPVDTYTDATGTAENTNPIILDARGEANIWLDPAISYKFVVKSPVGVFPPYVRAFDQIQAGSGGSGGLTRVYYNDSSSIAFSGLGTLATPLSSSVKLSTQPNNALQIRADGLYAMAIGGGGSVAWGSITGNILAQTDLINKFGEYLPLTFASTQELNYTNQSRYVFEPTGKFIAQNQEAGSAQFNFISINPKELTIGFDPISSPFVGLLGIANITGNRTWTLPDASGTIALTSQIPSVPVTSVFGRTGAVTAQSGDYTTAQVTESGNLYFTEARVRSTALTGFSATNSAIVATDSVLIGFNKAQGQINNKQNLNSNLTELSALSGSSGLIRRTGSTYVYDNAVYITASALADYIKKDGTTPTTALIPFANGASFGDAPSGLAIQLTGASKWIGSGTSPTTGGSALLLDSTSWILRSNTGNTISTSTNNITYNNNAGSHIFQASGSNLYSFNSSVHSWDGGIGGSSAKYQFNGSAHIASTLRIGSIPTGTQVGLVGYDANGNLIQGTGGGGGSYVTLSGHNDLTTPMSMGNANTWDASSTGIRFDETQEHQTEIKGNARIVGVVDQAITLYRPLWNAGTRIGICYEGINTSGVDLSYATACGFIENGLAGSEAGSWRVGVAINGTPTERLAIYGAYSVFANRLRVGGGADDGVNALQVNGSLTGTSASFSSTLSVTGLSTLTGGANLVSADLQNIGIARFNNNNSAYVTSATQPILYSTNSGGAGYPFLEAGNLIISPRISGATRDVIISTLGTRADLTVDRSGNTSVAGTLTSSGLVSTPASTTSSAGLRVPHGTAPSSPVNGDLWTTTTAVLARINGATRTFGLLGVANDWATIQTARGFAVTGQTNTPTGTTYTWTLTSGNQLDITLTSSTGDVTITTASPSAGAYSILSATGHGTLARNLIITQSGVTFIMTGKTSGNSITLDSIPATKRACYILYWITTTKCFIDRVTLEA